MVWLIPIVLVAMLWLRQSVLVLLTSAVLLLYLVYDAGHPEYAIYDFWEALNRDALLIVPVFLLACGLMSRGASTFRIVDLLLASTRGVPGGVAIASLISAAVGAALCGSPAVALLAVGPMLYQALVLGGYSKSFAIGWTCSSSVVGVLLPPSMPLVLYGVVTKSALADLYIVAVVVAVALAVVLLLCGALASFRAHRQIWDAAELREAILRAIPALCSVAVLFGGIYSPFLTPMQSVILFLLAVLLVEGFVYRTLGGRSLLDDSLEVCRQLGRTLPLVAFSVSLSVFLLYQQLPMQILGELDRIDLTRVEFLLLSNFVLLLAGMIADILSALLVITPLIEPLALGLDIGSVPFGVMLVLNLAIGYLTPPTGLVLVAAMFVFKENFTTVFKAVAPFLGVMIAVLFIGSAMAV